MTDLHAWTEAAIGRREVIARGTQQPSLSWQDFTMDGELRDDFNAGTVAYIPREGTRAHIAANDPDSVLRHCAADRKLLVRHTAHFTGSSECAAQCGRAHWGIPVCNHDGRTWPCPDVLDLAGGYGWTEDVA